MFWAHGSILVEYIKIHKKIEPIWWTFDKGKGFFIQRTTCPHVFLECIKRLLKHGEFSWKFCSCSFENIRIYFRNQTIFLIYNILVVIFQKFKKSFSRTIYTLFGFFFPCFHHHAYPYCWILNLLVRWWHC
jgi:hypothetical protein